MLHVELKHALINMLDTADKTSPHFSKRKKKSFGSVGMFLMKNYCGHRVVYVTLYRNPNGTYRFVHIVNQSLPLLNNVNKSDIGV